MRMNIMLCAIMQSPPKENTNAASAVASRKLSAASAMRLFNRGAYHHFGCMAGAIEQQYKLLERPSDYAQQAGYFQHAHQNRKEYYHAAY